MPASDPLKGKWKSVREHGLQMNRINGTTRESDDTENEVVPLDEPVKITSARDGDAAPADEESAEGSTPEKETFGALVERANKGEQEALAALGKVLDERPDIWRQVGDLANHARLTIIKLIAGGNVLLRDSLVRKADELLNDLSTEATSPLERLAVERVVAAWLQAQHSDAMAVQNDHELCRAKYWSQRQDQAHRRYDAAMKQLVTIRELLPPAREKMPAGESDVKINESTRRPDDSKTPKGATA